MLFFRASLAAITLAVLPALAAPAVFSISHTNGPIGTQVTLTGSGFNNVRKVEFGQGVADFVILSATSLRATVPPDATEAQIRVSDATTSGSSSAFFLPPPRIASIDTPRGPVGAQVGILGQNFHGTRSVKFGTLAASFNVTGAGSLLTTVPAQATNAPIYVETYAGTNQTRNDFIVTTTAPLIDGFSTTAGAPGSQVGIDGYNFINVTGVRFGGVSASRTVPSSAYINATVPSIATLPTNTPIIVTTTAGSVTSTVPFTVTYAPIVTNLSPIIGKPGTKVTFSGINCSTIVGVGFNGASASFKAGGSQGYWEATIPTNATSGRFTVTNLISNVRRSGSNNVPYTVTSAPIITSFDPAEGLPGASIVILGYNLSNGPTTLYFGTNRAAFRKLASDPDYVLAYAPTGGVGGHLTLSNASGAFTTPGTFSILNTKPFITSFEPTRAPRGTLIDLRGYNFVNPVTVRFNGVAAPETTAPSTGGMFVTVPPDATTGPITITTPHGTNTNVNRFEVPPRLDSLSNSTGYVGDSVLLRGRSLTNTLSVEFNGTPAAFTYVSDSNVVATVPLAATTGKVRLTTLAGTVLSLETFQVLPRIDRFDPPAGLAGTSILITGTTLQQVNKVEILGNLTVVAPHTNISSTQLRATVPNIATPGRLRVTTTEGTSFTTSSNFLVTTSSDLRLALTASATLVEPGTPITSLFTITNAGSSAMTSVRLINSLPPGLTLDSVTSSQGSWSLVGSNVIVDLGILYTNSLLRSASITIRTLTGPEGAWTNRATVDSAEPDWSEGNNSASLPVTVLSTAHRSLQSRQLQPSGLIEITWPVSSVPLRLQETPLLPTTTNWTFVPGNPTVINGANLILRNPTNAARYHRLAPAP